MNIQIFSLPRSGTGYLADLLKQSPAINSYISEPFNLRKIERFNSDYEAGCIERWHSIRSHADGLLIKQIHHYLYNQDSLSETLKDIHRQFESHVRERFYTIKLVRRNLFEQNLSECLALTTNVWASGVSNLVLPVEIDADFFSQNLVRNQREHKILSQVAFEGMTLFYEDLTGNPEEDWKLIPDIPAPKQINPVAQKKNPNKKATVANYQELEEIYYSLMESWDSQK